MAISPIITESFVCQTSDLENHVVSVNMTDEGVVTLKIDGQEDSSYRKEIMESQPIDSYVERMHNRLARGYESLSNHYLRMHAKAVKTITESDVEAQIRELKCEQYEEKAFELVEPDLAAVEADLKEDAGGEDIVAQSEIDKYVASHIEDSYNYRLLKWKNLKKYHAYIQSVIAKIENDKFKKQYDDQRNSLQAVIDGEPVFVSKKLKELETSLTLPYSTDIDYAYDSDSGLLELEMASPRNVSIPHKRICISDNGELQIVKTSQTESIMNQTTSMISSMFYLAWSMWNMSTKIRHIKITNWQIKNQTGLCWFDFERSMFEQLNPAETDVIEMCKQVKHVFDLEHNALKPIRIRLFEYAIQKGRLDVDTLLGFANASKAINNSPISNDKIERPQIKETSISSLYNDFDCDYPKGKPELDAIFANWCYKLIEHSECSMTMFVLDFGMSLDSAKDFMWKLIYMHFVGGKREGGKRPVLIKTESELEYRLSWEYHNESWKY